MRKAIIVFSLLTLIGCASAPKPTAQQIASADYGPFPTDVEQAIKDIVESKLIDPASAVYKYGIPKKGRNGMSGEMMYGWNVCGTINSRNRFGGYVGAKPFYAMINNDRVILFLFQGITIPDSFKMGIISGTMSTARSSDSFCKD